MGVWLASLSLGTIYGIFLLILKLKYEHMCGELWRMHVNTTREHRNQSVHSSTYRTAQTTRSRKLKAQRRISVWSQVDVPKTCRVEVREASRCAGRCHLASYTTCVHVGGAAHGFTRQTCSSPFRVSRPRGTTSSRSTSHRCGGGSPSAPCLRCPSERNSARTCNRRTASVPQETRHRVWLGWESGVWLGREVGLWLGRVAGVWLGRGSGFWLGRVSGVLGSASLITPHHYSSPSNQYSSSSPGGALEPS